MFLFYLPAITDSPKRLSGNTNNPLEFELGHKLSINSHGIFSWLKTYCFNINPKQESLSLAPAILSSYLISKPQVNLYNYLPNNFC